MRFDWLSLFWNVYRFQGDGVAPGGSLNGCSETEPIAAVHFAGICGSEGHSTVSPAKIGGAKEKGSPDTKARGGITRALLLRELSHGSMFFDG